MEIRIILYQGALKIRRVLCAGYEWHLGFGKKLVEIAMWADGFFVSFQNSKVGEIVDCPTRWGDNFTNSVKVFWIVSQWMPLVAFNRSRLSLRLTFDWFQLMFCLIYNPNCCKMFALRAEPLWKSHDVVKKRSMPNYTCSYNHFASHSTNQKTTSNFPNGVLFNLLELLDNSS